MSSCRGHHRCLKNVKNRAAESGAISIGQRTV